MNESSASAPVRLAIVGHVDHGKSTLIGRLLYDTGSLPEGVLAGVRRAGAAGDEVQLEFITDHLAEERREAKTIDTTQVFFESGGRRYVIIDTPGHAEFLKNMFTGASRADAALLVVDVQEGVRPQTLAHCHVLGLLGIRHVVPMVNKLDRVGYSQEQFESVAGAVSAELRALGIEPRPPVPISARQGDNIVGPSSNTPWYSGPALLKLLAAVPEPVRLAERRMRFAVQGGLEHAGERLCLGRVEAGTLRSGQAVRLLPDGGEGRVGSIVKSEGRPESAEAGECVGMVLADGSVPVRGTVVCDAEDPPQVEELLTGRLFWMAERPLERGEPLELRVATQEVSARVDRIAESFHAGSPDRVCGESEQLAYGEIGLVRVVASGPVVHEVLSCENVLGTFVLARSGDVAGAGTFPG